MPGPTIQWTPIDTTEVLSEIREEGRYRLASPSAVKGAPSLAMQAAGQNCTVKVYIGGVYRSDALLTVPSTAPVAIRNAVGQPLTGQEMFDMVIEVGNLGFGSVILTTDEPNGSPSAPFTTEAERTAWATANLASLLPGRTTAWGPGNVEYVWKGPLATDWQGIRGPYSGSAENPFPSYEALPAPATAPIADVYIPALSGAGLIKLRNTGTEWAVERATSPLFDLLDPIAVVAPGSTAPVPFTLATIPVGMWRDGSAYRYRFTLETAAGNTGSDTFTLTQNGVSLLSLPMVPGILYPVEMVFQRVGTVAHRRIIIFTSGVSTSNVGAFAVNFAVAQPVVMTITPANGANSTYLRYIQLVRQ